MSDEGRVGIFSGEEPLAEFVFGVGAQEHFLVSAFVLDYTEIGDMLSIILGAFKFKKHQALVSFVVATVILHNDIIVKGFIVGAVLGCLSISCFDWLGVALMVPGLYIFLAHDATHQTTVMIVQACSGHNALTYLAFSEGGTEGFLLTGRVFMSGETLVAFIEAVAFLEIDPIDDRAVLGIAQLAEVSTRMVGNLVEALFTFMAILLSCEKGWHTSDDVVVVVVIVEVQAFVGLGTRRNHGI